MYLSIYNSDTPHIDAKEYSHNPGKTKILYILSVLFPLRWFLIHSWGLRADLFPCLSYIYPQAILVSSILDISFLLDILCICHFDLVNNLVALLLLALKCKCSERGWKVVLFIEKTFLNILIFIKKLVSTSNIILRLRIVRLLC